MKLTLKPNGYPARRKAIQDVKNRFYFVYGRSRYRGPLWGIVVAVFMLFQSCEYNRNSYNTEGSRSTATADLQRPVTTKHATPWPGDSLLLYSPAEPNAFSRDYINGGYRDDLYLRSQLSENAPEGASNQQALTETGIRID